MCFVIGGKLHIMEALSLVLSKISVLQSKVPWNKCCKCPFIKLNLSQGHVALQPLWHLVGYVFVLGFFCVPESLHTRLLGRVWLCWMNLVLYKRFMTRKNKKITEVWDWKGEEIILFHTPSKPLQVSSSVLEDFFFLFFLPLQNNLNASLGTKIKKGSEWYFLTMLDACWYTALMRVTCNAKQSSSVQPETSALSNIPGLIGTVDLYYPEYLFPRGAITIVSLILSLSKEN